MYRSRIFTRMLWQQRKQLTVGYVRPLVNNICVNFSHAREQGTLTVDDDSYVKKFMRTVGWMDQSRTKLKLTGYFLYEAVPNQVKYPEWFRKLNLPDTFASWFVITELHVWLLLVRYMADDITITEKKKNVKGDGHFVRNCVIEALWADVGNRIKLLEGANPAIARKQVTEISEQFQAALVAYDEGLSDDRILASAIWRRFFSLSEEMEADKIETIVHFVRHQLSELDKFDTKELKWRPQINWLSILDH